MAVAVAGAPAQWLRPQIFDVVEVAVGGHLDHDFALDLELGVHEAKPVLARRYLE